MSLTTIIYIAICFFVIFFSLLQQNQSGGLGVLSGSSDTLLGTQQMSFMSKLVTFFAVLYFFCSFFLNIISSSNTPAFVPQVSEEKESTEMNIDASPDGEQTSETMSQEEATKELSQEEKKILSKMQNEMGQSEKEKSEESEDSKKDLQQKKK